MVILLIVIFGLCLGSFVNALVWRINEQEKLKKKKGLKSKNELLASKLNILNGRSMCPNCKHELSPVDLIPIVSWIALGGKCRYCRKPISWQYPLVEAVTTLLFIVSYAWWPATLHGYQIALFILWLILLVGLIALAVYDLKWMLLPNRIIRPLLFIALVMALVTVIGSTGHLKALLNVFLAVLIGGGIFYVLFQVSKGKWIGGGDVRLGLVLGLVMSTPGKSILLIFLASVIGTAFSLPLLATNKLKRNSVIPFGPFLIIAAVIVELLGHFILSWYQNTFFPGGV